MKFAERNFERPIVKGISHIEHMNFQIDPKQLSDLLDFVKFQNYSIFYGIYLFNHSFNYSFQLDRCREYRELCLEQSIDHNKLTQQQKDRLKVKIFFVFNLSYK